MGHVRQREIWGGEGAALGGSWAAAGLLGWAESRAGMRGERNWEERRETRPSGQIPGKGLLLFFYFKVFSKQFSNPFENILTFPKITQYNENKCSNMNAQQVTKSYDKF